MTSREVRKDLKLKVTDQTVRNNLKLYEIQSGRSAKKPKLTAAHKKARLDWALKNISNSKDDWERILWSNESRFRISGNDRGGLVWRKKVRG